MREWGPEGMRSSAGWELRREEQRELTSQDLAPLRSCYRYSDEVHYAVSRRRDTAARVEKYVVNTNKLGVPSPGVVPGGLKSQDPGSSLEGGQMCSEQNPKLLPKQTRQSAAGGHGKPRRRGPWFRV